MNGNDFEFKGSGKVQISTDSPGWQSLQRFSLEAIDHPEDYHTEDKRLIAAINTALTLGMPLLLTGPAGVGKTQLAYRIAYELGCATVFFPVKSTSEAQDLFYHVDHLRRLHAAQVEKNSPNRGAEQTQEDSGNTEHNRTENSVDAVNIRHFIRFQGLGLAILRAMPRQRLENHGLWHHAWPQSEQHQKGCGKQQPSVVLIDEIDKAPMDFCNDMLEEIRRLQFTVPELGHEPLSIFDAPDRPENSEKRFRPQIIITSNSEKGLPEPFLRRCIYYDIPSPSKDILKTIIAKRLMKDGVLATRIDSTLQSKSLSFYLYLRDQCHLEKPPSTAELLNWFLIIGQHAEELGSRDNDDERWLDLIGFCLLKHKQDQSRVKSLYQGWAEDQNEKRD